MISPNPYNELKCLGLSFISYILQKFDKFLSNSEIVRVQGRNDSGGSCSEKNAITSQIRNGKKRLYSDPRPKLIQQFLAAIMEKRFHQLFFYLIKISHVLTELLIWIVFCSCDILMPKLGPFPPAKAGGL